MRLEDTPGPIDWEAAAKLYEERLREAYKYIEELEIEVDRLESGWVLGPIEDKKPTLVGTGVQKGILKKNP